MSNTSTSAQQPPYSVVAEIYDTLMQDVNYELWSDFIDEILQVYHEDPHTILELACGTGSLSIYMEELECYEITATDKSPEMIRRARAKARAAGADIRFSVMDFLDIDLDRKFDAVVSTFDSVNYLHNTWDIVHLLEEVQKVLRPGSIFVFDFTTPRNSRQAVNMLNKEQGESSGRYRFQRKSRYDPRQRFHYNEFTIEKLDEKKEKIIERFHEVHTQKIYTLDEMLAIIGETDYKVLDALDGFSFDQASNRSLRITMILQCPTTQS